MLRFFFRYGLYLVILSMSLVACEKKDSLVLYTSLPERDMQMLLRDFKRAHPNVDLTFFRSHTNELITKLKTELIAGNPKADLIMIADDAMMEELKEGRHLATLDDIDVSSLPRDGYDKDKTFFGIAIIGTGLVCHKDFSPRSTSLHYLTDTDLNGQVCMASPVFSGSAAVNLSIIALQRDFGWSFWEQFIKNNPLLVKGNGAVLDTVTKKGCLCGMLVDSMALAAIGEGAGLSFHYFKEGTPVFHHPVAVLKESKRIEKATLFVSYVLSREGQQALTRLGYRPIRSDVRAPAAFDKIQGFKEMMADNRDILARINKDRENFARNVH